MQGKWAVVTFVSILVLAGAGPAGAEAVDARMCPAPISICHPLDTEALVTPTHPCPPGSICTCVPSCPTCLDCPVQVCIPDEKSECRTACDCPTGLGCFDGRCIAGFAPVYCCEADVCPAGQMCQHQDGTWERLDRCPRECDDSIWRCRVEWLSTDVCGEGRTCTCTTTCPFCESESVAPEVCGPPVCVPQGTHPPLLCDSEADCPVGRRCACVPSCPTCDDCNISVCVPDCDAPSCEERVRTVTRRIAQVVERTNACRVHSDCALVDTSTECLGTCGEWVNRRHERRVLRFVHRLDRRICSTFNEDGCPTATPACLFQRGLCIDGECRGVSILPRPLTPESDADLLEIPLQDLEDRLR